MRRTSLDIDAVRARMRQLVTDRVLACDDADQTWTGDAIGKRCDGCREPIRPPDVELEAEMPDGRTFIFHERCHEIWREVCDELSTA